MLLHCGKQLIQGFMYDSEFGEGGNFGAILIFDLVYQE